MSGFDWNKHQREAGGWKGDDAFTSRVLPRIECADGFSMSVQASATHYCTPRESKVAHYTHVEVGFPTAAEPTLLEYAEDPENPTGTVYGWVPVKVVEAIINAHGGVKEAP